MEGTAFVPEAKISGAARGFKCEYGSIQDFSLFCLCHQAVIMCFSSLLLILISSSDILNKCTVYNHAHFTLVNQWGWSSSIIFTLLLSLSKMLSGLNSLKASPLASHSSQLPQVGRSESFISRVHRHQGKKRKAFSPTWTNPVRCSSTPTIGSCRRWLFLRLSRDRFTPEKTPRGRLCSRLALRNNSWREGMESKVPGSTSLISLYSK